MSKPNILDLTREEKEFLKKFSSVRIKAIESYSGIEWQLSELLGFLLDSRHEIGATVFFRITNTRSRYAIISDLFKLIDGRPFGTFWNKLEKQLGHLDTTRNHLVHWIQQNTITMHGERTGLGTVQLKHPIQTVKNPSRVEGYSIDKISLFKTECDVASKLIQIFVESEFKQTHPSRDAWHDIFRQPPDCQNLGEFLQFLADSAQKPPPQSSPE